jgi:PhnB protein
LINQLIDYKLRQHATDVNCFPDASRVAAASGAESGGGTDDQEAKMPVTLNPYLNFRDTAREAMEFYHSVFGGDLRLSTFEDFQSAHDPSENDLIMHGQLDGPEGLTLMGADTPKDMDYNGISGVSISISGDDDAQLRGYWGKLVEGGNITQPLEAAPWGDSFGMVVDRYGVTWLVNITGAAA